MGNPDIKRRDSKHRILRNGESIRTDGKYQFKYRVNGKIKFIYSWKLEATDKLPSGKKPGPVSTSRNQKSSIPRAETAGTLPGKSHAWHYASWKSKS